MSWILASISDALLTRMINCDTSAQVWKTLEQYFSTQVRAKITQFKTQFHNTKKCDLSISDYLFKIRNIIDHLALVGHNLFDKDHINAVFEGLLQEYETFIISISSRIDPYAVEEIEALLLAEETRIEKNIKIHEFSAPNLAYLVIFNGPSNFNQRLDKRIYSMNSSAFSGNGIYHDCGNSSQRERGRSGRGSWRSNNKPQCQLYGRMRHVVMQCYYRFD